MTLTHHLLPFQNLSPRDFERLCLWLARREGFEKVDHLGDSGNEGGRDLEAWRNGQRVVFQCKREKRFGPGDAQDAVEKILLLPDEKQPDELILVVSCSVSDTAREKAREAAGGRFACTFWAGTELDERVKRHDDVVLEFFGLDANRPLAPFILPQGDTPNFTGRLEELDRLRELLLTRKGPRVCGIVGLAGTGGIGKSALACHFAELYRNDFPDGVIGLRVDGKDPDTLARDFLRSCGIEVDPEDERPASALMQEVFRPRRALLIFDNADNAAIQQLLPGGERCAVLITTRDQGLPSLLNVPREGTIDLHVLPGPECEQLLGFLLGSERVDAEPQAVAEIIRLVGNLPLALQIVGANLQMQPKRRLVDYASLLAEERSRLEHLQVRGASHLDVRASFSLSLRMLEETEVDFLASLSVCARNGFSILGAKAASGCNEATAYDHLTILCRYSLLNRTDDEAERFVFHPLIHLFASELAEDRGVKEAAEERHTGAFIALAKSADLADSVAESTLAEEIEEVLLAARCLQLKGQVDYDFVIRLEPFFQRRGHWREATTLMTGFLFIAEETKDWQAVVQLKIQQAKFLSLTGKLREAETALKNVEADLERIELAAVRTRCEAMWLNTWGGILLRLGDFGGAASLLQKSITLEIESGNRRGHAKVLNSLGGALQRQGQFNEAAEVFQRSYELEMELGNRKGQAMTLNSLGGVFQRLGQFDRAADAFQRSHLLLNELGDRRGRAMVLNSLGGVLQRLGQFEEALTIFQQSHELEVQLGNQRGLAMVLNSIGGVFQRLGRFDDALDAFQKSYPLLVEAGDQRGQAMVLNSIGGVFQRLGRFDDALDAFQKSYPLLVEAGDQRGQAMVLNSIGGVFQRLGRFDDALDAFQKSHTISQNLSDQRSLAMVLNSIGGVFQRLGRFGDALDAFQKSHELEVELDNHRGQAMVLNSIGGVFQRLGQFNDALGAFQKSHELRVEFGSLQDQAMILNSIGGVFQRLGRFDDALDAFQKSYTISQDLNDQRSLSMVLNSIGSVLHRLGRFDDALGAFQKGRAISEELNDQRGLAMILNSVGGTLQRLGRSAEALDSFQRSLSIGKALHDDRHLSMVYTNLGKFLASQKRLEEAALELGKGFEIDARLRNRRGLTIVTPTLIEVLLKLGRRDEARERCQQALSIAPREGKLLRLESSLAEASTVRKAVLKRGVVQRVLNHARGYRFAFIAPDDGGPDIYAREGFIDRATFAKLRQGITVEMDVESGPQGPRAVRLSVSEEATSQV